MNRQEIERMERLEKRIDELEQEKEKIIKKFINHINTVDAHKV